MTDLDAFGIIPLTLDSATNPTEVNFSALSSSLTVGDQYTFQVTAQDPNDATISASYTITVTIIDLCTITSYLTGQVQPTVPPEWATYTYTGIITYEANFATDQPNC